ncbi:UDP-glucuronic acid decarboxylase family protein [Histidinibacterium lentulum]|uniref:SDR family oxidoreductase n=1 Tax=Histidinibacterium lentulum TaxID=2480588 RepID=A0A3N2R8Y3_9RHOB|nr:UDP-glucuronic acid decarboxylase family protein [Histidinibacterium lentulum]ROU03924.1 SDR family oxidoreductase [Histidinibacterium lentulum]
MRDLTAGSGALTILVTGGAGFVGSHLCDALLAEGHRVICLDNFLTGARANVAPLANNPRFTLVEQDVCEMYRCAERLDRIYNLACPASPVHYQADPVQTMMTCVLGTGRMLDLAAEHGARLLQASTSEVYGDPEEHPQRESYRGRVSCTGPRACYDEGKRAAEALCFDSDRQGRVDTRVARIFNTYGPRMRPDDGRVVSNLIVQALAGERLTIHGHGAQTRSFCYVSDLVRGLMALMETEIGKARPVNLGNPGEYTIRELADMVLKLTGSRSGFRHLPMPRDDPGRRCPDISLAAKLLGWRPEVPLEEGLRRTIGHYRAVGSDLPVPDVPPCPAADGPLGRVK